MPISTTPPEPTPPVPRPTLSISETVPEPDAVKRAYAEARAMFFDEAAVPRRVFDFLAPAMERLEKAIGWTDEDTIAAIAGDQPADSQSPAPRPTPRAMPAETPFLGAATIGIAELLEPAAAKPQLPVDEFEALVDRVARLLLAGADAMIWGEKNDATTTQEKRMLYLQAAARSAARDVLAAWRLTRPV